MAGATLSNSSLEKDVQHMRLRTPGFPKFDIICPIHEHEKISSEYQKQHCSCFGMLLDIVKHLHPNNASKIIYLSKLQFINETNKEECKKVNQIFQYVLGTIDFEIIDWNNSWKGITILIICSGDSNFTCDPHCWQRVSGFVLNACGILVSLKSKAQHSNVLSSSETAWVAT